MSWNDDFHDDGGDDDEIEFDYDDKDDYNIDIQCIATMLMVIIMILN